MKQSTVSTLSLIALSLLPSLGANAANLTFAASDPSGDQIGPIDIIGTTLEFDNVTGAYTIEVRASDANPFVGDFRVNWISWNENRSVLFVDNVNDFSTSIPETSVMLSGVSPLLIWWQPGDQLFLDSAGSSSPMMFGSGIYSGSSFNGWDRFPAGSTPLAAPPSVPDIASTGALLTLSLIALATARKRLQK